MKVIKRMPKNHNPNIGFAITLHELAHLYLGHLGEDDYLKIRDRSRLTHEYKELEAESVCYQICRRNGVEPDSNRCLADYVRQDMTVDHFDLYAMLKSAGQIETAL